MTKNKDLLAVIKDLSTKRDKDKTLNTLLIIANLLYQNYDEFLDGATLRREIFHGRLKIIIDYRKA